MGRNPQISTASLRSIIFTLLGTAVLVISVQGTEIKDLEYGSRITRGRLSTVYRNVRHSTSEDGLENNVEEDVQPTTVVSFTSDTDREVTEGAHTSWSQRQRTVFSAKPRTSPEASVISPVRSFLKQEDIIDSASDVGYTTHKPDYFYAQAPHSRFEPMEDSAPETSQTVAVLENDDGKPRNVVGKVGLYSLPKDARDIIALNSELLGYNTERYENAAEWHSPEHEAAAAKGEEHNHSVKPATETSTPADDTATRKRIPRRRGRKGQKPQSSRIEAPQNAEPSEGGEDIHIQTLRNRPSGDAIKSDHTTLPPARNKYGVRKVKYTGQREAENYRKTETLETSESVYNDQGTIELGNIEGYRRETLPTSQSAYEPNSDVEKANEEARYQTYRKPRPRYRVKIRRRGNHTLIRDENEQSNEVSMLLKESTQENVQETTESPATTPRTFIVDAINELEEINAVLASQKEEPTRNIDNSLQQPLTLPSKPLIQNVQGTKTPQQERTLHRKPNISEKEIAEILRVMLNRPELLLPQQYLSEPTQNLQNFRNFTKRYEEDSPVAASTIRKNVSSIQQPKLFASNDTLKALLPPVYLLGGIPTKVVAEKDLVTSEQQRPENAIFSICRNSTIPEIIECIRNFEQTKSSGRKGSYTEVRNPALRSPVAPQPRNVNSQRSPRNSTAALTQLYLKPAELGISPSSAAKYNDILSFNRIRKTVSSVPQYGVPSDHGAAGGKPHAVIYIDKDRITNIANSIATSLAAVLRVGGRLLLSQLQKLKGVLLQIPAQLGRLSAEAANQKLEQKFTPPPHPIPLFPPHPSAHPSFSLR